MLRWKIGGCKIMQLVEMSGGKLVRDGNTYRFNV